MGMITHLHDLLGSWYNDAFKYLGLKWANIQVHILFPCTLRLVYYSVIKFPECALCTVGPFKTSSRPVGCPHCSGINSSRFIVGIGSWILKIVVQSGI